MEKTIENQKNNKFTTKYEPNKNDNKKLCGICKFSVGKHCGQGAHAKIPEYLQLQTGEYLQK